MNLSSEGIAEIYKKQERSLLLQALRQQNETLQSILNNLAEGVIVADKNGRFVFFNPVAEHILGIGLQKISQDDWAKVYGTYYLDKTTPYPSDQLPLARAIRGEKVIDEPIFIKNPERPEGVYIEVSASPLKDKRGAIVGGTVIVRDVTKIKEAEAEKEKSETRVKAQFKGFPIPTYVWQFKEDDFVLVDYNDAAAIIDKNNIQKFLGKKTSEMFADMPEVQADFVQCFRDKNIIRRELLSYRFRTTSEQKEMVFNYIFVPPDLILLHTEDITEQKNNIDMLKKLSSVVEQTADSVVITNNQGVIEYVNPAFEVTTGYKSEEAIGQTPSMLKSGIHDKVFYNKLWKTISGGKTFRGTIINKKKNGELYWSEQTITPMKDKAGNILNFVSLLKDITELKKRQEQEVQLNIARDIQERLYNKTNISVPGFDIAGAAYSAVETSGDYFDFISFPDGRVGLVLGDVMGHGIGPALIMTMVRSYLRAFAKLESDPAVLLTWINKELVADLNVEQYVTMILARIDPRKSLLEYASAGHVPAYLLNNTGEIKNIMESTGIPLGFINDQEYVKSESIKLAAGDIAVFLTDGIIEADGPDDTQFGYDRTLQVIRENQQEPAQKVIEHIYEAVHSFSKNQIQEDDVTAIICKVNHLDN